MKKICVLFIHVLLFKMTCWSQVTLSDYQRADSTVKFRDITYYTNVSSHWIDETSSFWYRVNTPKGDEYFLVDVLKLKKLPAFDQNKLCKNLNTITGRDFKSYSIPFKELTFGKNLKEIEFIIDSTKWNCNLRNYAITKVEDVKIPSRRRGYWGRSRDELSNEPVISPDSNWVAFIKNFNVFIKKRNAKEEYQLSFNGSEGELYSSFIKWAPDSKKLATYQVRLHTKKYIYFVESSPEDQLQPKLHKREYLKPGDALPIRKPCLFNVEERKQIPVDTQPFEHQYSVSDLKWWNDSRAFTFEFNQRGHQVYQVVEVDAQTGNTKILIDERSNTFIDYSGKKIRRDVKDGQEIIWASERDGWNHLYLFNSQTGKMKNQITKGEWVVRDVVHVDEDNRQIVFRASGMYPGEDPYLIYYYRINFDGTELTRLTTEMANHRATFSEDYKYFIDNYSRVDLPPVTVLRSSSDGKVLMQLEKADITKLLEKGWNFPEVFAAKGRDGKTDIWGIIYKPTDFDSTKTYPVIEYIYAGPHSSHVMKSFLSYYRSFTGLAELGFIIVQIDGMGTSNRSKAFHDICWKNIKDAGFPDRILWIKAAGEKYPYLDTTRVGIFGTSAGGQNALAALLFHPEFYKVSVSSCGCHDNRMDKIWWNEHP
ncbi:MAG: prolyl oligopeptidase family serine peptidase, partial [Bacteroidetes bacterium]|nr:prolyl oligopeptidase family serine peptidase [Bacteroidota bacterium]